MPSDVNDTGASGGSIADGDPRPGGSIGGGTAAGPDEAGLGLSVDRLPDGGIVAVTRQIADRRSLLHALDSARMVAERLRESPTADACRS